MKIDVAVLNQGSVRTELVEKLLKLSHDQRYDLSFTYPSRAPVASNRNYICKQFREGDADFLLMTDDDQHWEKNPLDMVEHDLDVVGFPTSVYQPVVSMEKPVRWNMIKKEGAEEAPITQVSGIGSGSLLIARRVLEHPDLRAPFMDKFDEDGIRVSSEDLRFCDAVWAAGFQVWAVLVNPCHHLKTVDLLLMHKLLEEPADEHPVSDGPDGTGGIAELPRKLWYTIQRLWGGAGDVEGQ